MEVRGKIKCWEFFNCDEQECPVQKSEELRCWLVSETHCRDEIQGKFIEKIEMCVGCEVFKANIDVESMEQTLTVVNRQFTEFRGMVEERDRELEGISLELALGLSEVFEALKEISAGDPEIRIPETSELELITKLKHMVNLTAINLAGIVNLSHEFAIGLAEHFDVLHRVSEGELDSRVSGVSQVELLESLKKVTNQMIESVSQEITHRTLTEAALRESEERYRAVLEASPDAIVVYDTGGNCTYVNPAFTKIFGWTSQELIGKQLDYVPEENWPETQMIIDTVQMGKSFSRIETRRYTKHGSILDVSISAGTHLSRDGTPEGSVHILRDITKRKLAEEALRESQERYRALFDYDPNSIFVLELETFKILNANARGLEVYGYKKEELVGKSFMDLGTDRYLEGVLSQTKIASSILCSEYPKVEHRRKDGHVFYVNVYACQAKHGGKRIIIATTVDITESVTKEALLNQADKMSSIGEMAAGVAHELNNPIAIILGFTELLLERFPVGSKEFKMLETIERQAVNCKYIVENLLTFTRIPHKITSVTDIVASLEKVVNMVKNTLLTKKVDLHTNVEEPLPQAKGDSQQIEQVFLNIINNAVAAMDSGGTLTILACRSDDMVSISFRDTGHGISPKHMDKIFEPFFTTKKVGEGTGLGLSVSYGIVKKFGGDIQVKSKQEGEDSGTIFTVTLPAADAAADVGNRESDNDQ
jgi:PAS domain S-box-containing protein